MNDNIFKKQADLLLSVLPYISADKDFALHGGTAINFFFRDMPRLSVDIDLTYLPKVQRQEALAGISDGLKALSKKVIKGMPETSIEEKTGAEDNLVKKLMIRKDSALVKIEPNQVIRGCLSAPETKTLCKRAGRVFEKYVEANTLSFAEIYGSKICAALDRQHPRDIFDIMLLLNNEGITENVRKAFIVFLISHNRPIAELLKPNLKDMQTVFNREFDGMTIDKVSCPQLLKTRKDLLKIINAVLTENERFFLLSFKQMTPKWELLGVKDAKDMPAVRWKMENLTKMNKDKHKCSTEKLKKVLGL